MQGHSEDTIVDDFVWHNPALTGFYTPTITGFFIDWGFEGAFLAMFLTGYFSIIYVRAVLWG